MAEWLFWMSAVSIVYAYAGYPLALWLLSRWSGSGETAGPDHGSLPTATMIVPAHNERDTIEAKLQNTRRLEYPAGRLEVVYVTDGCSDGTPDLINEGLDQRSRLIELPQRGGKAAALNAALQEARNDIVVFSDASIMLAPDALMAIVRPFRSSDVGCVSGEDEIQQAGGEGLYGRYELLLRRLESRLHSIVGASGSFYAQRRALCEPFVPNLAPDFLSVLRTVERGYRAISEPGATGTMSALENTGDEFRRKVRTVLRGITTLARYAHLLNPFRYGFFAFELISHKLARWLVPFFLVTLLATSAVLAADSTFYRVALALQLLFYGMAATTVTGWRRLGSLLPVKVSVYFTTVNLATLSAWLKYVSGTRQEFWSPSKR
jgi:cellulose synthase/poly-beta-1,6-N-acetylglucosamine synthase-like glycosyltransferase